MRKVLQMGFEPITCRSVKLNVFLLSHFWIVKIIGLRYRRRALETYSLVYKYDIGIAVYTYLLNSAARLLKGSMELL